MKFDTASDALIGLLGDALADGRRVVVRGSETAELSHQHVAIAHPLARYGVVPERHGNVFASIVETLWVLAGRDDIATLEPYLPRAALFSDDGRVWRGAYGPRLRDWYGVDQLARVRNLLVTDPNTRRAVVTIFDPQRDYFESVDIPCTNWLQFDLRDGQLNLSVVMRSNDLIWGFSGINAFEWSVLLEMMARWVSAQVGELHFYVGSLHVYERHYGRADAIISGQGVVSGNVAGEGRSSYLGRFEDLDLELRDWFIFEHALRANDESAVHDAYLRIADPLLRDFAAMTQAYWSLKRGALDRVDAWMSRVKDKDLRAAGKDYVRWTAAKESGAMAGQAAGRVLSRDELLSGIILLHRSKSAAYGDSWKRRGELGSILPNIARKVDRFRTLADVSEKIGGEEWFDTAVDLLVYAVKYKTYLLDQSGPPATSPEGTWSDGYWGFEKLLTATPSVEGVNINEEISRATKVLGDLEEAIDNGAGSNLRLLIVDELILAANRITSRISTSDPLRARAIMRQWTK
ncbi:thymidylate synthase [Rathayibacter festucae]|uniref:thymidylate synthase n=1 Tax=Rathayibacter festucae TaxID=110937 RepID=UPI001FB492FE|nr:thymidylate synthase [Rathayibacter festucae]MCJ1699331.1 thymidylate synthase [Rathayibacter festucae]